MAELFERLQAAVGDTYRVEKELGGGGMSRVFLAEEFELNRKVVIKVLPPDMAASVNRDRFQREIQLAASLQHPHIVPLLTAGASGDLLYYVMPFIEGQSLRERLNEAGKLPVDETVRILREVTDALSHAHAQGIVHRDIKPDNVLLSGKHALVMDFGVAKAVTASKGGGTLTAIGVPLGTPAYMSPEQAMGDPDTDHRTDIYAVGALAYEMLTGDTPFQAQTLQGLLAAHASETPVALSQRRDGLPPAVDDIVMRCLAKTPADRWQQADELQQRLEMVATPSGGITAAAGLAPVAGGSAASQRIIGLYGIASLAMIAIVYLLTLQLGLPDWVVPAAVVLLIIGLPIIAMTGRMERRRVLARTTGGSRGGDESALGRRLTWKNALGGGVLGFTGLTVTVGVYMAMRLLGIGPAGTLVASGVLDEEDRIIIAEFENRTGDSLLGAAITEAFRIDLTQSPLVRPLEPARVAGALRRMERDANTLIDLDLAREVAVREGAKAVVAGEINAAGGSYVLSVRLVSASDGSVLAAFREAAKDSTAILPAIDELSKSLRGRIGESLRTIRSNEPLSQVTTSSLEGLRKYSQAVRYFDLDQDYDRAIPLLEEAIALDSGFAMAYRKLSIGLRNLGREPARRIEAVNNAYEHRDRLTDYERYYTEAAYWASVGDSERAIAAYRSLLDLNPDDMLAINNLGVMLYSRRDWAGAEELYLRAIDGRPDGVIPYGNAVEVQINQGKFDEAQATLSLFAGRRPGHPSLVLARGHAASAVGDYEAAERHFLDLREAERNSLTWRVATDTRLAAVARVQGRLADAERYLRDRMQVEGNRGAASRYLRTALELARINLMERGSRADALREIEQALERFPLESLAIWDRPYILLADFFVLAGDTAQAEALYAEYEREVIPNIPRPPAARNLAAAALARADERYQDAIALLRQWDEAIACPICALPNLAITFESAGEPDSAVAALERYLSTQWYERIFPDAGTLHWAYRRLGEFYEGQGDTEKAVEYYNQFVELWNNADPELRPQVEEIRGRMARLVGEPTGGQ